MCGKAGDLTDLSGRFPKEFFQRSTLSACRALIGSYLVHDSSEGRTAGRIVEVEGYLGPTDRASHSFGGRKSERNKAMFGPKGHAYVYFIYGMYYCVNVVTGPRTHPQAILIRALEPIAGIDVMRARLGGAHSPTESLCRGPGKLCLAMGITKDLYGEDLRGEKLYLVPGRRRKGEEVIQTPRINIAYAEEFVEKHWRFCLAGNRAVSGPAKLRR